VLELPIHEKTRFVLVRPHYPENVGAAARAMKTMGFAKLALVKPGRLAVPEHEMARKMGVKSLDVLDGALRVPTLGAALADVDVAFATTSHRGISGVLLPRAAAAHAIELAGDGKRIAVVFGNEKSGLERADFELCQDAIRIPMAADQPSINLAQAVQILAYELFVAALAARR
jgi:TrmH family RNA methyltransferase